MGDCGLETLRLSLAGPRLTFVPAPGAMTMLLWACAETGSFARVSAIVHADSKDGESVKGRLGMFQAMVTSLHLSSDSCAVSPSGIRCRRAAGHPRICFGQSLACLTAFTGQTGLSPVVASVGTKSASARFMSPRRIEGTSAF